MDNDDYWVRYGINGPISTFNNWADGDMITAAALNEIVNRIAALESAVRNPDLWEVYRQGFEAGRASLQS